MQKLFNMDRGVNQGAFSIPWWTYIHDSLTRNLNQVITHYRRFPVAVESSHFLIKLLTNIGIYRNTTFEQFCDTVFAKSLGSVTPLGMTSALSRGVLFDGVFYGEGVKEIIIAHDEDFNLQDARQNWRDLEPVKVLSHPKSDLGLMIPNGTSYNAEEGLAVISINLPMLAVQYREFRLLEDRIAEESGESPRSIMQFIHAYPLNNMLRSHLDCVLFNRLNNTLQGIPFGYCKKRHPFQLLDVTSKLNELNKLQIELFKNSHRKFDGVMKEILLVTCNNLQEFSVLPECAPTRQVIWALAVARIPILAFLARSSGKDWRTINGSDVNRIQRSFGLWHTDKALRASLPVNLYHDYRKLMRTAIGQ